MKLSLALKEGPLALTALALIIGLYLWRLLLLKSVGFNPDEFWHLHAAWCLSQGMIPYRDFFEHHTPWLYFLLAPFLRLYRVDIDPNAAVGFIFLARRIMALFAAIVLILTFFLGYLWRGPRVAWLATALLSTSVVFGHKTLEIRPDVPALVLWLGCLVTLVRAEDEVEMNERRGRWLFILSGVFFGSSLMTLLKMLVVIPGFALAMLWYVLAGKSYPRKRLLNCLLLLVAFSLPIAVTSLFFWGYGAFRTFFNHILMNLVWRIRVPTYPLTRQLIAQNPVLALLGSLGLVGAAFRVRRFSTDGLLVLTTAGAIGGVFALPTPWPQNYLIFLPLLALCAGDLLTSVADCVFAAHTPLGIRVIISLALALLASGAIALLSASASLEIDLPFAMFVVIGTALLFRFRSTALALLLIAFSLHPICQMRNQLSSTNEVQLQRIRYVLLNTLPTDTVMDGWSGLGVFRRSAWFYPFIHGDIPLLLNATDRNQLLLGLQSGKIAPKFIFPNEAMLSISLPVTTFLLTHYAPVSGVPYLLQRK